MKKIKFSKIDLRLTSQIESLENILKFLRNPYGFFHVVSLNPENIVIAEGDQDFRNILSQGDIQLIDGIGLSLALKVLGQSEVERVPGVDFMDLLLQNLNKERLNVLFIGGRPNLAKEVADCYNRKHKNLSCTGIYGFNDIKNPTEQENNEVFSIVADHKPQIVFAAFGSPWQEKWFWENKDKFKGVICMGVGQGFDVAGGVVKRAPAVVRAVGMEWLYRLITQPWRWRRQLRLIKFIFLVVREKLRMSS